MRRKGGSPPRDQVLTQIMLTDGRADLASPRKGSDLVSSVIRTGRDLREIRQAWTTKAKRKKPLREQAKKNDAPPRRNRS